MSSSTGRSPTRTRARSRRGPSTTRLDDLTVPGDLSTGITHLSGLFTRVTGPNGGTVLSDAGMFLVDAGTGESLHQSANHPFDDYFAKGEAAALAPLCNALD